MPSGIDATTGKEHQNESRKNWERQYYRNHETLIRILLAELNGLIRCKPCENYSPRFSDEVQFVEHLRRYKKHVVEFFLDNIEDLEEEVGSLGNGKRGAT